jgi:ureidoglycolate hydrolase
MLPTPLPLNSWPYHVIQGLWEQQRDRNKTANGVRQDVVRRLYQDVFDYQNFVPLHGTRLIVIICPHKKSSATPVAILTKLQ